jgi:glycerol kinase
MSANGFLMQCLADFTGLRVAVSNEREATTRGAGLMALVGIGALTVDDVENLWSPAHVVTPTFDAQRRRRSREEWATLVTRVEKTIPELSSVEF